MLTNNVKLSYYELIITEECNLRCKYCFDDYFEERKVEKNCGYNTSMDVSMIDDINNFILKTYDKEAKEIIISFFGGEPTLNWNFIVSFINKAKSLNIKFSYHINTNMVAVDSKKIDFMLKNNFNVVVSLDGKKETHDKNRINIQGKGSWKDSVKYLPELISKFKTKNKFIEIIMVVNKENYNDIYENYKFCSKKMKCNTEILFDFSDKIDNNYYSSLVKDLKKIKDDPYIKDPVFTNKINTKRKNNSYCFTPDRVVSINPKGQTFFCHQFVPKIYNKDFKDYYGNIYKGYYNLEYYEKMKKRTSFKNFSKVNIECGSCIAKDWCAGGCIAGHYWTTKNINEVNKTQCDINILLTKVFKEE